MESTVKIRLRAGDKVQVIAGKDKGKQGSVKKVFTKTGRILIEGVNLVKRHRKPTQASPQGGIVTEERAIDSSNVMILDPKTGKPTRIGRKWVEGAKGKDGQWVRIAKGSGVSLDEKGAK